MVEKYNSILKNDVWVIVPRPMGQFEIDSKWLYRIKHAVDGSIEKYKVIFIAKGFSHIERVDYEETSLQLQHIMFIAPNLRWPLYQIDMKIDFLNGLIEEKVYINQPREFWVHGQDTSSLKVSRI